ncbi:MAG: HlyU family transcriptional regulator [Hyphomicrobiaceae bacterium]
MSFLKRLFGGGEAQGEVANPAVAPVAASAEHKGFTIEARPYKDGGQYQLAGLVWKEVDGVRKEHRFIRADRFSGAEEAATIALMKGRQMIDERGERLFD